MERRYFEKSDVLKIKGYLKEKDAFLIDSLKVKSNNYFIYSLRSPLLVAINYKSLLGEVGFFEGMKIVSDEKVLDGLEKLLELSPGKPLDFSAKNSHRVF